MTGQDSLTDSDAAILRNVREGKPLYDPQVARLRQIQRQYGFTFAPKKTEEAPQPAAAASPTPSRTPVPAAPTPSPTPTPLTPVAVTDPQMPRPQPPAQSPAPAPAMGLRNVPNPLPTTPPEFKNDEEARTWLNAAARSSEIRLTQSQHALRERLNDQAGDDLSRALASAGDMLPGLTDLVSGVVQENLLPGPLAAMLVPGAAPIYAAGKLLGGGPAVSDDAAQTAATAGEGARKVTISTRQIADWAASQVQTVNFEREREDMVRQQLGDAAYEFPPLLRQEVERRKAAKEAPYDGEGTARRNALTYEIYNRNKDLEQAFEGRSEYYQGGELVQRTPDIFGASPVTISNPVTGNTVAPLPYTSTGLAIVGDPLNIAAGAFGGLSKLRLLSRAGSRLGIPLGGIEKGGKTAGAALTGFADRLENLVNRPRIDPATGQPVARSLNLSAVSAATGITAGTVLYQMDDSGTLAAGVGAVGLAPLALRGAGFTFQKVGSSAGKWSVIAREMAAGPLGSGSAMKTPATQAAAIRAARPAVAEELLATGNVPPQYAKYMRTATDDRGVPTMSVPATRGADGTLKRVAQNREAPPAVRIAARAMDRSGLTGGFRMLDDAFSGGVSGAATGLPFAAIAPEPEYAGAILGGSALFGTLGGPVGGRTGRRKEFTDSDVARMMVDIKSRGGDPFTIVQQARPKELATTAAMQGVMANKGIDFMPLRADEYGAMVPEAQGGRGYHTTKDKDGRQTYFVNMGHYADFDGRVRLSDIGDGNTRVQVVKEGQDPYSFVVPESRKGRLRVKDGDEVKAGQMLDNTMSNSLLAAAHEFMHPIMLSDMFAGPHKPVLHGLMYDMYGPEGIEARKREYVGLMVDDDIASGVSPGSRVEYTAQEQSDMATGKRTPADIMRERGVVDKTRDELIADKIAELDDQYQREFGDRNAWIADEMLSEYWRSYGNEIDINKLRGSKSPFDRARAAEGVSVFNQRLLGLLGMTFDPQTGKPLTIPSQLFRDNPLIDTPVIRRRVNETVRLYDQYLKGLEDAGAVDAPGTPLPKTDNPNDYAKDSRVVMPEDPTTGVRDDDFAVVGPDGNARFREPDEIKEIERTRAAQVADMASRERGREAAGGEFGMHTDPSGRKILRGDKLPDSFYLLKSFPEHAKVFSRQLDEVQDRGGVVEVTFNRVGEKNDGGSWKPTANRSAAESVTRRMIPFGRQVSKTNQILAEFLDLDAVNAAAMKMINNNELPAFNNDLGQLTTDLKTYLANHRNGLPGETGLTVEKRNILNALVGTGTAVQRKANPLVGSVNARGAVRTVRLDRIVRLKDTAEDGLGFDNDRVKGNRMPDAEPVPDGMPDAVETLTTDQLQRQYEENQGYLGLSTLGMREGRPVRGGAAQTRELLRRNEAISAELERRGVRSEDPQLQRALQRRGQAMPDAAPADAPPFYMKSAQVLDTKIQGKAATADQVRAILKNPQNGIKAEELKWTGVEQAVERIAKENGGKVPKEALLRYLQEDGAVRLEDVTFGGKQTFDEARLKQLEAEYKALKQHPIDDPLFGEEKYDELVRLMNIKDQSTVQSLYDEANRVTRLAQQAQARGDNAMAERYFRENEFLNVRAEKLDLENLGQAAPPRFGQYQLPGGENYREVVLAMGNRLVDEEAGLKKKAFDLTKQQQSFSQGSPEWQTLQQQIREIADRQADLARRPSSERAAYTSTHFPDTPNYVAHARLNERADAAGKPGLFLEEIQSDRHQAGREKGYAQDTSGWTAKETTRVEQNDTWIVSDAAGNEVGRVAVSSAAPDEARAIQRAASKQGTAIPDAPFRKDWPVQMFKRALADAVGSGKEWIGWTTGETQAGRYDLSKQIDRLTVTEDQNIIGSYRVQAFKDGSGAIDKTVKGEELPDVIGKDLAQKAMDNIQESRQRAKPDYSTTLTGLDLKVGGEGMKGFYDQILPKEISKYVKQWGAQVEKSRIGEPKKGTGKLTRDEVSEARREAKQLIRGDISVEEFNDNWGTRLTDEDVPGNDPYREPRGVENVLDFVRDQRKQEAGGTFEAWRVNITPQMREGIKKAGQALFVGGAAAVVAEDQLEQ